MALPGRGQGLGGPPGTKVPSWRPGWQGPAEGGQCLLPAREGGAQFPLLWGLAQNPGALGRRQEGTPPGASADLLTPSLGEAHPFCSHPPCKPQGQGSWAPRPPACPSVSCSPSGAPHMGPFLPEAGRGLGPPQPASTPPSLLRSRRGAVGLGPQHHMAPVRCQAGPSAPNPGSSRPARPRSPVRPRPGQEAPPTSPPTLQESRNTQG